MLMNEDKKPLADMNTEDQIKIFKAWLNGSVEFFDELDCTWLTVSTGGLCHGLILRIPSKKLDIPWEHLNPAIKWVAMDKDGDVSAFSGMPVKEDEEWMCGDASHSVFMLAALNIDTDGVDWEQSLTQRPEG